MFQQQTALAGNSRVGTIADAPDQPITAGELTALAILGASAACWTAFIRLPMAIPGSSLVYAILPIALGFAVVPRKQAGTVMSGSAIVTAGLMSATGLHDGFGFGATASLLTIGPLLDLALARAGKGWRLYAGFVLAGLGANMIAFVARGGAKLLGLDVGGQRLFDEWLSQAAATYVLAGGMAGLLSGACWFRLHRE